MAAPDARRRPVLLCYDWSDAGRHAIEEAAALLGRGPAIVLHVWETVAHLSTRHPLPGALRSVQEAFEDIDKAGENVARKIADEGLDIAREAGFDAEALAVGTPDALYGRTSSEVWRTILQIARDRDVAAIVVGARGLSVVASAMLGSVSGGVVAHSDRPVLVVPPPERGQAEQG